MVSCSVLKEEIEQLVNDGALDVELVFVDKYFHVEYGLLEENLRLALSEAVSRFPGGVVVVYGDLCLGPNGEIHKLMEEFGVVKVDALNCIDCLLGGKGVFSQADPNHEFLFLGPGMTGFFRDFEEKLRQETNQDVDPELLRKFFVGLKGIVLLDSLGAARRSKEEIEKLNTGLPILEIRKIGLENLKSVIREAIARTR